MASPNHQPHRRAQRHEFSPLAVGVIDRDAWSRLSRDERAAWMRRRQELKRLVKGKGKG